MFQASRVFRYIKGGALAQGRTAGDLFDNCAAHSPSRRRFRDCYTHRRRRPANGHPTKLHFSYILCHNLTFAISRIA